MNILAASLGSQGGAALIKLAFFLYVHSSVFITGENILILRDLRPSLKHVTAESYFLKPR